MNFPITSVSQDLLSMLPYALVGLVLDVAWWFLVRRLMRGQDASWVAIGVQTGLGAGARPSDRLFIYSNCLVGLVLMAAVLARMLA